jgi:DNA-directed RNA polymerase III subunit RPC7
MPPMGLSFADLATLSREPTALYPSMDPLPVLSALSSGDKEDIQHQIDFENKMRSSPYYIVELKKSTGLLSIEIS